MHMLTVTVVDYSDSDGRSIKWLVQMSGEAGSWTEGELLFFEESFFQDKAVNITSSFLIVL